jgi:hypothetical protein
LVLIREAKGRKKLLAVIYFLIVSNNGGRLKL